jgi:outer membrane receptor protein involved in Fe transport
MIRQGGSVISPYVEQTYSPTSWLDLNAGARIDVDDRYSPVVSPRGAIGIRPLEKTTFKVIYSQAFRAPTPSETSLVDYTIAPSPGLGSETVRSLEASIEQRFATQRVVFGVFRSWWESLVELQSVDINELNYLQTTRQEPLVVGSLLQFQNVATIDNYGWNGGWEGSLADRRLRYGLNATGAFTQLHQGGQAVHPIIAPQVFGNAHVGYWFGHSLPAATLAVYGMGPRPLDRTSTSGATLPDAPALADLRLALSGRVPSVRAVGYSLTADYTTASTGPYMAGPSYLEFQRTLAPGAVEPTPVPVPIDQFRVMVGLRFDFLNGGASSGGESQ